MKKKLFSFLLVLAMLVTMVPVATVAAEPAPQAELTADDLYVQGGLIFALDARVSETIDLTNNKWYSVVGDKFATFFGTWTKGTNSVGYRIPTVADFEANKAKIGLQLPSEFADLGDFTVESVFDPHGISGEDNVIQKHDGSLPGHGRWGAYNGNRSAFNFAGLQMCMFNLSVSDGASMQVRTFYHKNAWEAGANGVTFASAFFFSVKDASEPKGNAWADGIRSMVVTRTVTPGEAYNKVSYTAKSDLYSATVTNGTHALNQYFATAADMPRPFEMFVGFAADVYVVRVYDRVLTAGEQNQNHFADLCNFYGIDLSGFAGLSDRAKIAVYTNCASVKFDASAKATVEGFIANAVAAKAEMEQAQSDYDKLYVQDGLMMLFSAFDPTNASVDLANSQWKNILGDGTFATVKGGAYSDSNKTGWKAGANGGIGWSVIRNGLTEKAGVPGNGIVLSPDLLPAGSFTAELVGTTDGPLTSTGERAVFWYDANDKTNSTGGIYGTYTGETYVLGLFRAFSCYTLQAGNKDAAAAGTPLSEGNSMYSRWYLTTTQYGEHNHNFGGNAKGLGICIANNEKTIRKFAAGEIYTTSWTFDRNNSAQTVTGAYLVNGAQIFKGTAGAADLTNGGSVLPANNSNSLKNGASTNFQFGMYIPGTMFSLRVYDRVLTAEEMELNHMIDLAAYYGLDVSLLLDLPQEAYAGLASGFADYDFNEDAETVAAMQNTISSTAVMYELSKDYYVTDGLVNIFEAFTAEDTTEALEDFKWTSKLSNVVAELKYSANDAPWRAKANGGIYYYRTGGNKDAGTNVTLPISALPKEDYTINIVAHGVGQTTDYNGNVTYKLKADANEYTAETGKCFVFGPLKAEGFNMEWENNRATDTGYNTQWFFYSDGTKDWGTSGSLYGWGINGGRDKSFRFDNGIITWTITHDLSGAAGAYTAAYNTYKNATTANSFSIPQGKYPYFPVTDDMEFVLFRGLPVELYAIRIYDRVLSTFEIAQNHFADLVKFNELDTTCLKDLDDALMMNLYESMQGYAIGEDKDVLQKAMEETASTLYDLKYNTESFMTDYDKLYVRNGLTLLLTAYEESKTMNLQAGKWYNLMDGTQTATIFGGVYSASNATGWKVGAKGGISYRFADIGTFSSMNKNVGISLPVEVLPDKGAFTVETVFDPHGISGEDNVIVPHTGENGQPKWGAYNGSRSAFNFVGLQVCQFHQSSSGSGNSLNTRFFYSKFAWEAGANGTLFHDFGIFSPNGERKAWVDGVQTMTVSRTINDPAEGKNFKNVTYTYQVGKLIGSIGNGDKTGKNDYFLGNAELANAFEMFVGFPANVYAIRAYDRILTDAEKAQNHFADLAAYLKLDVSAVFELSAADQAKLFAAYATMEFVDVPTEYAQKNLDATIAAMNAITSDGIGVELSKSTAEEQKAGIMSNWSANGELIAKLAALGYTVEVGAVMGVGNSAEELNALVVTRGAKAYLTVPNAEVIVVFSTEEDSAFVNGTFTPSATGGTFSVTTSVVGGLEDKSLFETEMLYRGFIAFSDGVSTSVIYTDVVDEIFANADGEYGLGTSFLDVADYFVNDYVGDKLDMYEYNQNPYLNAALNKTIPDGEIELDPTDKTPETDKDVALGDATVNETVSDRDNVTITDSTTGDAVTDDVVVSEHVPNKIRPVAGVTATYSFTTYQDGVVKLVIEYVAKDYTLGDRGITVKVDNYAAEQFILSDDVTGIDTDVYNHGYYVVEFTLAAGEHTVTLTAPEVSGANPYEFVRPVEIFGVTLTDK